MQAYYLFIYLFILQWNRNALVYLYSAGKIQISERTKAHLDEIARDQFIVELRQPKVLELTVARLSFHHL